MYEMTERDKNKIVKRISKTLKAIRNRIETSLPFPMQM